MGDFLMKENKNITFLNSIYQISEMGVIGINDVIDKIKKQKFREFLEEQRKEFDEIVNECEQLFISYGAKEQEIGKMTRMSSKMMAQMRLMNKKEDEVIAQMMSKGLTKGITKLEEAMNKYNDEDEEALLLADKLRRTLKNIFIMKNIKFKTI